jgi:hypothetical protein
MKGILATKIFRGNSCNSVQLEFVLTINSLCVLRDPYVCTIRKLTKNTTKDTKDTKEVILYLEILSSERLEFVAKLSADFISWNYVSVLLKFY